MKTFTPYQDPIPEMKLRINFRPNDKISPGLWIKFMPNIPKGWHVFDCRKEKDLKDLCLAMYNNGFKDGVKAHKKIVAKHYNELMEHFQI